MSNIDIVFLLDGRGLSDIALELNMRREDVAYYISAPSRLRQLTGPSLSTIVRVMRGIPMVENLITVLPPSEKRSDATWTAYVKAFLFGSLYTVDGSRHLPSAQIGQVVAAADKHIKTLLHTPVARSPSAEPPPAGTIAHPAPTPSNSNSTITKVVRPAPPDPDVTELLKSASLHENVRYDSLACWMAASFGNTYDTVPGPIQVTVPLTREHLEYVYEGCSIPLSTKENEAPPEWSLRQSIKLLWYFKAVGSGLPHGALKMTVGDKTISLDIYSGKREINVTRGLEQLKNVIRESFMRTGVPPSLTLRLEFMSRTKALSIQTALLLRKQLEIPDMLEKLYETALISAKLAYPHYSSDWSLKDHRVPPKAKRDFSFMQSQLLEHICASPDRRIGAGEEHLDGIECGDYTLGLTCPFTTRQLKHPAKGRNCRHRTAFDAETFLIFNEAKDVWKCPVTGCGQNIEQSDLNIDLDLLWLISIYPMETKCVIRTDGTHAPFLTLQQQQDLIRAGDPGALKRTQDEVILVEDSVEDAAEGEVAHRQVLDNGLSRREIMRARRLRRKTHALATDAGSGMAATRSAENIETIVID
ncbi:hypothetical protein HDU81_003961 [Chytriomyces hyalinus]|nr:hypothetical protein HDU81_003961 [Chytriomyces hyalinus]